MKITLSCICDLDNEEDFCSGKNGIIRMLQADKAFCVIDEIKSIMRDAIKYPKFEYDEKTSDLLETLRSNIHEIIHDADLVNME